MSQADQVASAGAAGRSVADTVEACSAAGLAAIEQGDLEEAAEWAARCDAAPNGLGDARCASLHGAVAVETGDFDGAAAHFRRAVARAPSDVTIARQLGEALAAGGALNEAAGVLEGAVRQAPDDADLLVDLGYLRLQGGDRPGARDALERAASLRPGDGAIRQSLAEVYEALGEDSRAIDALAGLAREAPSPRVWGALARLYLRQGRYVEAERAFGALEALDPEGELLARHGQTWCRIKRQDWRGALDVALGVTKIDRLDLTTAFLAYAKDRLFTQVPEAEARQREAELAARFAAEWREYEAP